MNTLQERLGDSYYFGINVRYSEQFRKERVQPKSVLNQPIDAMLFEMPRFGSCFQRAFTNINLPRNIVTYNHLVGFLMYHLRTGYPKDMLQDAFGRLKGVGRKGASILATYAEKKRLLDYLEVTYGD